jgi:hypothetical protein
MIYDQKLDWADPNKGMMVLHARHDPFKTKVLDYHIAIEAALADLINQHFRGPEFYDIDPVSFSIKVRLARALIGPTPDDSIWKVIGSFSKLRNIFAHSSTSGTQQGIDKIENLAKTLLLELRECRPDIILPNVKDKVDVIELVAMTVHRFFREITDALVEGKQRSVED